MGTSSIILFASISFLVLAGFAWMLQKLVHNLTEGAMNEEYVENDVEYHIEPKVGLTIGDGFRLGIGFWLAGLLIFLTGTLMFGASSSQLCSPCSVHARLKRRAVAEDINTSFCLNAVVA